MELGKNIFLQLKIVFRGFQGH